MESQFAKYFAFYFHNWTNEAMKNDQFLIFSYNTVFMFDFLAFINCLSLFLLEDAIMFYKPKKELSGARIIHRTILTTSYARGA